MSHTENVPTAASLDAALESMMARLAFLNGILSSDYAHLLTEENSVRSGMRTLESYRCEYVALRDSIANDLRRRVYPNLTDPERERIIDLELVKRTR